MDDGYRNTAEFLRARLRIGAAEARRRLSLAEGLLPRQGLAGRQVPPAHRELAAAVAAGEVASRAASVIAVALERVRPLCDAGAAARMEHALTRTAAENDADFLVRVTRSWADALDQDGAEPSEELLRQLQGAFIRRRRHGLHHLEIYATTEQFEHLLTVMNTGANPRTGGTDTSPAADTVGRADTAEASAAVSSGGGSVSGAADDGPAGAAAWAADVSTGAETPAAAAWTSAGVSAAVPAPGDHASSEVDPAAGEDPGLPALDLRSRAQKLLDGLVGACKVALTAGTLPAAGGLRPQVMATIDYRDLLTRLGTTPDDATPGDDAASGPAPAGPGPAGRTPGQTGTLLFTGPVTASTVRQIACDADIIPVLLGRRRPGPGHRPGLQNLPAPHPQSPHRPGPGLRLPRLHHPGHLVRGPPHRLLVPRRNHRDRERDPALLPPPPRDPQGTLDHPAHHRDPLVHPATPPRPTPATPPQPLLPPRQPPNRRITTARVTPPGRAARTSRPRSRPRRHPRRWQQAALRVPALLCSVGPF